MTTQRDQNGEGEYIHLVPVLNRAGMETLADVAGGIATNRDYNGYVAVISRLGCSMTLPVGNRFTATNEAMALKKARTALNLGRSITKMNERFASIQLSASDFGELVLTTCPGGVIILDSKGNVLGAIAFSGALPLEDEGVCLAAIYEIGLRSDIPEPNHAEPQSA